MTAPGEPPASPVPWLWLVLAAAGVAVGIAGRRLLFSAPRYSDDPRLNRAARAVVDGADSAGAPIVLQGRRPAVLRPLEAYLDRERAVRLAVELERLRRRALEARATQADPQARMRQVADVSVQARDRLASFLKVDGRRAQLLLYAGGWPWVGIRAEDGQPGEPPLAAMTPAQVRGCLELARQAVAWPEARERLTSERGLSEEQAFAVRAQVLRSALGDAFNSKKGARAAREALAKYAALAPAQARAVLAMRGAVELVRAGSAALPALEVMAQEQPALADALREAVRDGELREGGGREMGKSPGTSAE